MGDLSNTRPECGGLAPNYFRCWRISDLPACPLDVRCRGLKRTRYAQSEFFGL